MKPTLLILAAGMASRYGSMKQTEGFGPAGETIMDYSIYDAIKAGFGKVVFIIREDFAENFKASFDKKLLGKIEVDYVYQDLKKYVDPAYLPADRTKPWGTGHAMLCAIDAIHEPFAVINADDYYGVDAFAKAADFLLTECSNKCSAIIGYELSNTLSVHGTVSRGVCDLSTDSNLIDINERTKIYRKDGGIVYEEEDGSLFSLADNTPVSMNFWCFHPSIYDTIQKLFAEFPKNNQDNIKAEFFIPIFASHFINNESGVVKLKSTSAQWFGVTYKEDAASVKASIDGLIADKTYPPNLWDL